MGDIHILSVDLGLRVGLAWFDRTGCLLGYRSHNFGTRERMRRGVWPILRQDPPDWLVLEGDRLLARIWTQAAQKQGICWRRLAPEHWRARLLTPSATRSGADAKAAAGRVARRIIAAAGLPGPTSLRHDAAEAICIGHCLALELSLLGGPDGVAIDGAGPA